MPARASPAPRLAKSGPPESPKQIVESVPGGPIGGCRLQHRCVVPGTPAPEQLPVLTAPTRLIPESNAPLALRPKPTIVPGVPRGGEATEFTRDGRTERSAPRSFSTAASPWTANWKPGTTRRLSTKSGRATCWRKTRRPAGSARKVVALQAGPVPPALHTQCAAVITVRQPITVALQRPPFADSSTATLGQSWVGSPFTTWGSASGGCARAAAPRRARRAAGSPVLAKPKPPPRSPCDRPRDRSRAGPGHKDSRELDAVAALRDPPGEVEP